MKAEIITIGTELLLGQIVNTNTSFLSRELTALGIEIYHHTSVGDNPERLKQAVSDAEKRADLLVLTGGLGPTKDDITKKVVADHLKVNLVDEKETKKLIDQLYEQSNTKMPKNNYNQSQILEGSDVLTNENGMAPGVFLEKNDHIYVMLPGVPSEMVPMVKNYLAPKLKNEFLEEQVLESRLLRFYGITESRIAEKLDEIIEKQTNPTVAIYVDNMEITVRITAKAKTSAEAKELIDEADKDIQSIVSGYFFGYGLKQLPEVVHDLLIEKNLNISMVEVGTGGYISSQFTKNLEDKKAFKGSLVLNETYYLEKLLPIPKTHFEDNDMLSEESTEVFAEKISEIFESDIGISIVSSNKDEDGQNNSPENFWIGIYSEGKILTRYFDYSSRRSRTRRHFLLAVMNELRKKLNNKK